MYLLAVLGLLACLIGGLWIWPRLRASSLLSGLLLAPFCLLSVVFVPAYWQPDHHFTFLANVGCEDALFCFACGGISWLAAANGSGVLIQGEVQLFRSLTRFGIWSALALLAVLGLRFAGWEILGAVLLGFSSAGCFVMARVSHAWRLMLPGAFGFALTYVSVAWAMLALFPAAATFWTSSSLCGHRVLGLPVEEMIWAVCFGAIWPVVFAYCVKENLTWPTRQTPTERNFRSPVPMKLEEPSFMR